MVTLHTALVSLSDDTVSNTYTLCIFKHVDNPDNFHIKSEIDKELNNINKKTNHRYRYCTKYHLSDDVFESFGKMPQNYEIQKRALNRCIAKQYINQMKMLKFLYL